MKSKDLTPSTATELETALGSAWNAVNELLETGLAGPATHLLQEASSALALALFVPSTGAVQEARGWLNAARVRLTAEGYEEEAGVVRDELVLLRVLRLTSAR